jgi:hypothetical protein
MDSPYWYLDNLDDKRSARRVTGCRNGKDMETYVLTRYKENSEGTFGYLDIKKGDPLATFELPWRDNARDISCIPAGKYSCFVGVSYSKGRCIHIKSVENRTNILIHVGNTSKDTQGCILVGEYPFERGVRKSIYALGRALIYLPDQFCLEIKEKDGMVKLRTN